MIMVYCKICGDEDPKHLTPVIRYWSPDDGWVAGRLCKWCAEDARIRKPHPDDYAYDQRGKMFSDEDDAISTIYG